MTLTVNTLNLAALKLFFTQTSLRELEKLYQDIPNLCMPKNVAASKEMLSTQVLLEIRLIKKEALNTFLTFFLYTFFKKPTTLATLVASVFSHLKASYEL